VIKPQNYPAENKNKTTHKVVTVSIETRKNMLTGACCMPYAISINTVCN
jgi:hypothetical protein